MRRHLAAGDLCAVVTATNSFVTGPIAREFGVPHLVATEPEQAAGRFTGRVAGTPCFREGKIARVDAWLAGQGRALKDFPKAASTATRTTTCRCSSAYRARSPWIRTTALAAEAGAPGLAGDFPEIIRRAQ